MIADLMIGFELATRASDGAVRLMEPDEILSRAPEATQRAANPWKLAMWNKIKAAHPDLSWCATCAIQANYRSRDLPLAA